MSNTTKMTCIKTNASNLKFECDCTRQFWVARGSLVKCPSCKKIWDGKVPKILRLKLRDQIGSDYVTILVTLEENLAIALAKLLQDSALVLYLSSGVLIEEITGEEYLAMDSAKVVAEAGAFLQNLRRKMND